MNAKDEINELVKSAASTVVWPKAVPTADTTRGEYSLFQKLIKTINGSYPDRLYYRDRDLVRNGWRESNGYLYEPPKEWMFRAMPDHRSMTVGDKKPLEGNPVLAGSPSTKPVRRK